MYAKVLEEICELIRTKRYVMTTHAEEEMTDDGLTIFDVEHVILTGKIVERQKDSHSSEWKYLLVGQKLNVEIATVVVKISITRNLVIITVFIGSPYDM